MADYDPEKVKIEKGLIILLVEHLCKWLYECGGTQALLSREQINDYFPDDSEDEEVEDSEQGDKNALDNNSKSANPEQDDDDVFDDKQEGGYQLNKINDD